MDDYLLGLDIYSDDGDQQENEPYAEMLDDASAIIGSDDWGSPFYNDDPSIGVPAIVGFSDTVLGELSAFNIAARQREMNQLKQVPVVVAQLLLDGGMLAINGAISGAKQPWYRNDLPGHTRRAEVLGKLNWHRDNIGRQSFTPTAMYSSASDLKKWVMCAFIEGNAVQEGAVGAEQSWSKMWAEIGKAIATLPKDISDLVGKTTSDIIKGVTGVPVWGWAIIAVGLVGGLGFGTYKLLNTRTAATLIGIGARRYLP